MRLVNRCTTDDLNEADDAGLDDVRPVIEREPMRRARLSPRRYHNAVTDWFKRQNAARNPA